MPPIAMILTRAQALRCLGRRCFRIGEIVGLGHTSMTAVVAVFTRHRQGNGMDCLDAPVTQRTGRTGQRRISRCAMRACAGVGCSRLVAGAAPG